MRPAVTERKPASSSWGGWVDQQIREAQERGDFDDLPGAGRPLPSHERPLDAAQWAADLARREGLDTRAMLPPSLALPREVEDLPQRLAAERSEDDVRRLVLDLNERIRMAHLRPPEGPPLRGRPVDVDDAVETWRSTRAAARAARTAQLAAAAPEVARRRRWQPRRRGR